MRIKLPDLQDNHIKVKKLRSEGLSEGCEDIEKLLHYQSFLYLPKVIYSELISRHHNNLFVGYYSIKKTRELISRKYYWTML